MQKSSRLQKIGLPALSLLLLLTVLLNACADPLGIIPADATATPAFIPTMAATTSAAVGVPTADSHQPPPTPSPEPTHTASSNAPTHHPTLAYSTTPPPGHTDWITALAFSPDGQILASGSTDRTIKLWQNRPGGTLIKTLEGHIGAITDLAFSPDGKTLISSGSENGDVSRLWSVADGKELAQLKTSQVAFSPDGKLLVGFGMEGLQVWDALTRQTLPAPALHTQSTPVSNITFSPDAKLLAVAGEHDSRLYRIADGQPIAAWPSQCCWLTRLAFSPDGKYLASAGPTGQLELRQAATGTLERTGPPATGLVSHLIFSQDGREVVYTSDRSQPQAWDISGQATRSFQTGQPAQNLALSPDGQILATVSQRDMKWWDFKTGQLLQDFPNSVFPTSQPVFSPNRREVAGYDSDYNLKIWSVGAGQVQNTFAGNRRAVLSLAFSPDGQTLAGGRRDRLVTLWSAADGQERQNLAGHVKPPNPGAIYSDGIRKVAFSPDGSTLASGGDDGTVRLWNPATGEARDQLRAHLDLFNSYSVLGLAFGPDGWLVSGGDNAQVKFWQLPANTMNLVVQADTGNEYGKGMVALQLSRDGKSFFTLSPSSGPISETMLKQWDSQSGQVVRQFDFVDGYYRALALSQDGKSLAVALNDHYGYGTVVIYEVATGHIKNRFQTGHTPLNALLFVENDQAIVTASPNGLAEWETATGAALWSARSPEVTALALSPDGKRLASGHIDGSLKMWILQ